jgi:hypothetical protein
LAWDSGCDSGASRLRIGPRLLLAAPAFVRFRPIADIRDVADDDGVKRLFLIVLAAALPTSVASQNVIGGMKCFHAGSTVRLTGTVTYRMFYGAPNYGEEPKTDRRVRVPILRLDEPVTPCDLTDFDSDNRKLGQPVREVQIDFWKAKSKSGARRSLVGTIQPATIGSDFLDYVLLVH